MTAFERIPAELRERAQWVIWRAEKRDGKATKVPYCAHKPGARASSTDPATWTTFEKAVTASTAADGVGFVFTKADPYVGVDLDEFDSTAAAIVLALDSYTERSVSGRGAHTILRGSLNGAGRNRKGPLEIFDHGRYFVVTGDHMRGTPETIEDRQAQLEMVIAEFPGRVRGRSDRLAQACRPKRS